MVKPGGRYELAQLSQNQTLQQTLLNLSFFCLDKGVHLKERTQELEVANSKLSKMAFYDSLTQLPNRAFFMEQLQFIMNHQRSHDQARFAVIYLDCDRFKLINDSFGHHVGDELLVAISQRLRVLLRPNDLLTRLGGDEFVILLNDLAQPETAIQISEQILTSFSSPFQWKNRDLLISFSIGIVLDCATYQKPQDLLRDADLAMYQAKTLGKNQYQIFIPSMYEAVRYQLQLETDLHQAIQNNEFVLHYQPIVELTSEAIVGVEALIRWHHPTYGLIPPNQFIPIAEETGFIIKLGYWILKEACYQLCQWQKHHIVGSLFFVGINVSAYQFSQSDFIQKIDEVLAETHVSPQCLKLEITETVIMQNLESMAEVFMNLHRRSIQLSIDDFGTGYSSLSYLHSFPVDNLKIDRSFVYQLEKNEKTLGLVSAIVQIAHTMEMHLIAEGIETVEQMVQLRRLGCQLGQGYLFSRPLESGAITDLLATGSIKKWSENCHDLS